MHAFLPPRFPSSKQQHKQSPSIQLVVRVKFQTSLAPCISSSHGWLTVTDYAEKYYQIKVLDPLKGERCIILPRWKRGITFNQVLTVPPDCTNSTALVHMGSSKPSFLFCRPKIIPGTKKTAPWLTLMHHVSHIICILRTKLYTRGRPML